MYGVGVAEFDHGTSTIAPEIGLRADELGAYVVAVRVNRTGTHAAAATGDGAVHVAALGEDGDPRPIDDFGALPISLSEDCGLEAFLAGFDDGVLRRIWHDGSIETVATFDTGWIENLTTHRRAGLCAMSIGRTVYVVDGSGHPIAAFPDHPSTPASIAFSPDGGRIAVARYNGVSLWDLATGGPSGELFWRGSHIAVGWSPDGRYIVTATQDRDLHCWRLSDGRDYRMSGYPSKIRALAWTTDSDYVAAAGADTVTSWYCGGDGPAGKPPLEFGYAFDGIVTQVAAHPKSPRHVAAGYDDGSIMIGEILTGESLIAKGKGDGPVTSLAWSPDGRILAAGTESGALARMTLSPGTLSA